MLMKILIKDVQALHTGKYKIKILLIKINVATSGGLKGGCLCQYVNLYLILFPSFQVCSFCVCVPRLCFSPLKTWSTSSTFRFYFSEASFPFSFNNLLFYVLLQKYKITIQWKNLKPVILLCEALRIRKFIQIGSRIEVEGVMEENVETCYQVVQTWCWESPLKSSRKGLQW